MFDRLLGPRIDHADPVVRAKAFAHDSIDQATLVAALVTEQDPDVLCVILNRANDIPAVLQHAISGDGSLANEARTRLVKLAQSGQNAAVADWTNVYQASHKGGWTQMTALLDALGPDPGREPIVQGALESHPTGPSVSERVLFTLATQSNSSSIRRLAAAQVNSRELLEQCGHELKEKDKTVYRELKVRLDAFKFEDDCREQASRLLADCDALGTIVIEAQSEPVAIAHARLQSLEQNVKALSTDAPDIAASVVSRYAQISASFEQRLAEARTHSEKRRELIDQLATLKAQFGQQDLSPTTDPAAFLQSCSKTWTAIPDHSDTDQATFERDYKQLADLVRAHESECEIGARLATRLDEWEAAAEKEPPTKLSQRMVRAWDSAEKPRSQEKTAELKVRLDSILGKLERREAQLAKKRAQNGEQLLEVLKEFDATMEKGEFKKALSLNDKLKARSANRELEPAVRRRIEDALKTAQPKLEEFRKWRHFGTQQARENLIGEANKLISDPPASPKVLSVAVKALRESWRKLDQDDGRASETQWQAFSKVCKEAYKPAKKHFEDLAKERKANYGVKKGILTSLESLLKETDWQDPDWPQASKAHKDFVTQWHRAGKVDYKLRKELDEQFAQINTLLDDQFKDERENEVARRRRSIESLKALSETETGGRLASAAKRAQRDWRPTVQSDRKTEQSLWEEFRAICDNIFATLKQQQKDAKTAWQSDANEREAVCVQVDALLVASDGDGQKFSAKDANLASGNLNELNKRWRERSQIPSGIMSKLEKRFKEAKRSAENRVKQILKQDEQRMVAKLDDLHSLCQSAEEAVLSSEFEVTDFEANSTEFEDVRGMVGKALQKRYARALKGMQGDDRVIEEIRQGLDTALTERQQLCLLGELIADIPSPEFAEQARLALKMQRLTEAMQGERIAADVELRDVVNRWYLAGGVAAAEWSQLNTRFAQIRAAQGGGA